jgi:hypothetical protein
MKTFSVFFALVLALATSGCSLFHSKTETVKPSASSSAPIVTPDFSLAAKVVSVNTIGRFVVLSFPASLMPKVDQTLFLYRTGLKTAEVRVTGPQQENNIVADLVSGDAQVGDTVSDK